MVTITRLRIESLLLFFSWSRQGEVQGFFQMQVMSTSKYKSPTVGDLMICKDEDPHELSYTSLRDLLSTNRPPSPIKPKTERESPYDYIEEDERPVIKNRLVELAARAYLLPSHAQATPANEFFSRQWARFSRTNRLQRHHSEISLLGNVSCFPGPLWMNITRAFCSLFKISHLRPQPLLQL